MKDSDTWYYHQDGIALGPFTAQYMESHFHEGTFDPDTLVWHPDQAHWLPLSGCRPSWSQSATSAILQPGPMRIPVPVQTSATASASALPDSSHQEPAPIARPALKPIARSSSSSSSTAPASPAKPGFLARLFGRKP
jgi:hypothetical protein